MIKTMWITNALLILIWYIPVNSHYTLYYSDIRPDSYLTRDCLYSYLVDGGKENGRSYLRNSHLIPYCRRAEHNEKQDDFSYPINENIGKRLSFKELRKEKVTSEELLQWFAPIDIAEKYQRDENDSDVFYNCSSPWFGSMCQYQIPYNFSLSLEDIVEMTLNAQKEISSNVTGGTCYQFLTNCNRRLWPLCLDWREICNGRMDCQNGEDEEWCDQLEMSECNDNEYRCHYGGQCIPLSFVKDSRLSIDCLDGSDEVDDIYHVAFTMNKYCSSVSTFRCEERISRYDQSFSCGNGQYILFSNMAYFSNFCANKKDKEISRMMFGSLSHISNVICRQWFYCAVHFNRFVGVSKFRMF